MAMISGGDESARNAFRAHLRDDSSQLSLISAASTEEMSAGDVLEVRNLADAIERAERALRESSRPRDMFAELGSGTDDASGPAVYAKPTLTPVPPPLQTPVPVPALPIFLLPSLPTTEEDAFMQPAGRMRHFAEETLDGYRPDSTLQVRIGSRRKLFTVGIVAFLAVLVVTLVAGVVFAYLPTEDTMKIETKPAVVTPAEAPAAPPASPAVRTMNVNDLPAAR